MKVRNYGHVTVPGYEHLVCFKVAKSAREHLPKNCRVIGEPSSSYLYVTQDKPSRKAKISAFDTSQPVKCEASLTMRTRRTYSGDTIHEAYIVRTATDSNGMRTSKSDLVASAYDMRKAEHDGAESFAEWANQFQGDPRYTDVSIISGFRPKLTWTALPQ